MYLQVLPELFWEKCSDILYTGSKTQWSVTHNNYHIESVDSMIVYIGMARPCTKYITNGLKSIVIYLYIVNVYNQTKPASFSLIRT